MPIASLRKLAPAGLAVWAVSMCVVASYLLGAHLLTLPAPDPENATFQAALSGSESEEGRWSMTHFLYADCPCSEQVWEHLLTSERPNDVRETVVLVDDHGGAWGQLAEAAGYYVESLSRDELFDRYAVEAAPLLAIRTPDRDVAYVGGYAERKRGPVMRDLELLANLREGAALPDFPLFGCPVSRSLSRSVDPLGIR